MNKIYSIAIDGPAGAGKSTIAKKIAEILNIEYIDTGAMFRAITLKVIDNKIDLEDESGINKLLFNTDIDFRNKSIFLDGTNVDDKIRGNKISQSVSQVAKIKDVRDKLLEIQRNMAEKKSVVMDGRDIGSIVLPNARFKFFLTASVKERATRRYNELISNGEKNISFESIIEDIEKRDYIDTNRAIAPLLRAEDAIEVDTTNMSIDMVVEHLISFIKEV